MKTHTSRVNGNGGGIDIYYDTNTGQMYERPKNAPKDVIGEEIDYNFKDLKFSFMDYIQVGAAIMNYVNSQNPILTSTPNATKAAATVGAGITIVELLQYSWILAL